MKEQIKTLVQNALSTLLSKNDLALIQDLDIQITHTKDKKFGDFACNIALTAAKKLKRPPKELAAELIKACANHANITKIELAGPGFINFYLAPLACHRIIPDILTAKNTYGRSQFGQGTCINFEFVSSNPTGPLHVGHGRSAAFGAALAALLDAVGYQVYKEYYVNDAGRQMDILAVSVWLRYLLLCGEHFTFPKNAYKGDYVIDYAQQIYAAAGERFLRSAVDIFAGVPPDEDALGGGDKEAHIDGLISQAKILLGEANYAFIFNQGLTAILEDIRSDLAAFEVYYDNWFSERSLFKTHAVIKYIDQLKQSGHTYEREGNLWFRSTDFNDDKDRVLIRQNGQPTYFAADIAYHAEKFQRGADKIVVVLGADHHGYVARVKAALQALGINPEKMATPIVQFATLFRGDERVQMSTRSGSFVTLRELREEIGKDAARFFYVLRKSEQHLEFDLELAKSQSSDNPVYYIQYAYARIASVFRQCQEKNLTWDKEAGLVELAVLLEPHEITIIEKLTRYPDIIHAAALQSEPHLLAHYLRELAQDFHTYYNAHPFLVEDAPIRNARLCLIAAVQQTLLNGLTLLGVSAPQTM